MSIPDHLPRFKEIAEADYEQNYYENLIAIKALVLLLPLAQRRRVLKWVEVLESLTAQPTQRKKRNLFTWYLSEQVRSGSISAPFHRDPDVQQLPDEHMLPQAVWFDFREVVENMIAEADELRQFKFEASLKRRRPEVLPSNFIYRQPCPKTGFTAYGACFSNQFN